MPSYVVHSDRRKPMLRFGLAALVLVGLGLSVRWWDHYVEKGLAGWAVDEVDQQSHGVYRLVVSDVTFRPYAGTLSFDSAVIITDSARNRRQPRARPALNARAYHCLVTGLALSKIFFQKELVARTLGCQRVVAGIGLVTGVRSPKDSIDPPNDSVPAERLIRPLGLSAVRVEDVSFPSVSVTLHRPGANGGASLQLGQATLRASELALDPTVSSSSRTGVSARRAALAAKGLILRPDTMSTVAIDRLHAGITDSTLRLAGARHGPSMTDEEWVRKHRFRRDRVRFKLDSLEARGVAYWSFLATGEINVRAITVRGAALDVLTDMRLPVGPPSHNRSPQAVAAATSPGLHLDTAHVAESRIVYHEHHPARTRAGRVFFEAVDGHVTDLDLPSQGTPLRIEASARLMNKGRLTVHVTVPLDAPDFRFELSGKLGPMPAVALNDFLSENQPFKLHKGQVDGVEFRQVARGGSATTTLTPRYQDLSVTPSDTGGGVFTSVKRAMKKVWANTFKVRSENPDDDGKPPRTVRTRRLYDPSSSWVQFLWFGLRDGLRVVVLK
jgi:hypothetical protein